MGLFGFIKRRLFSKKHDFISILSKQAEYLESTTTSLLGMFDSTDKDAWFRIEQKIKSCEVLGDALLTEFHEQLAGRWIFSVDRMDLQAVAMAMDDCLDVIKDTAKAVLIYHPDQIAPQLGELAQLAKSQSEAVQKMIPLLTDIKGNLADIRLQCDRVTELEHAADDGYEEYIGYIFQNVEDVRELIKYKNLAEMLENTTDAYKKISDNVRKLLVNFFSK
jgi:uncharacterized protein Yka (UPF0111/DUF47 family)